MLDSIHVTVGRPSSQKANGILQVVSAYLENEFSGKDQICFHMSQSDTGKRPPYTHFYPSVIGVFLCFIKIYKFRKKINKIYFYGGCQWRILLILFLLKTFNRCKITTVLIPSGAYSTYSYEKRNIYKKIFIQYVEFFIIKSVTFIQALSYEEKSQMINFLPKNQHNKIKIIPNAVQNIHSITNNNFDKLRVIYIGRKDVDGKGIQLVAEAVKELAETGIDIIFDIYGPIHSKESEKLINKMVNSSGGVIQSYDAVYEESKVAAYNEHNIFVLASRSEGLPTTLLEAAQTGIYCLATKQTNLEKDDWHAGIFMVEREINSIKEALKMAVNKKRKPKDIERQIKHFTEKYSFSNIRRQHDKLLKS